MKEVLLPVGLQLGAFLVGLAEAIIPSMGILLVLALGLFGASWYFILSLSSAALTAFFLADLVLVPLVLWGCFQILKHSPLTNRQDLGRGTGAADPGAELLGATGTVIAQLTPTGKAEINGRLLEVTSAEGMIEARARVRVTAVQGIKIIVEPAPEPDSKNT